MCCILQTQHMCHRVKIARSTLSLDLSSMYWVREIFHFYVFLKLVDISFVFNTEKIKIIGKYLHY